MTNIYHGGRTALLGVVSIAITGAAPASMMRDAPRSPAPAAEVEFIRENDAAMAKMMTDMTVTPSGDVDADFVAMMVPHHQAGAVTAVARRVARAIVRVMAACRTPVQTVPSSSARVGADALAGYRGAPRELFTEDCQAEIYRQQIARVEGVPWLRGFCAWVLYDFRSERRQTRFAGGFNRKGLIAENKLTRKLAFDALANWYREIARRSNGLR